MLSTREQASAPPFKSDDILQFYQFLVQQCPDLYPHLQRLLKEIAEEFLLYITQTLTDNQPKKLLLLSKDFLHLRLTFLYQTKIFDNSNINNLQLIINDIRNGGNALKLLLPTEKEKMNFITIVEMLAINPLALYTTNTALFSKFNIANLNLIERLAISPNSIEVAIQNGQYDSAEKMINELLLQCDRNILLGKDINHNQRQLAYANSMLALCALRKGMNDIIAQFCALAIEEQKKIHQKIDSDYVTMHNYICDLLAALNDNAIAQYQKGQYEIALESLSSCISTAEFYKIDNQEKTFVKIKENFVIVITKNMRDKLITKEYACAYSLCIKHVNLLDLFNAKELKEFRNILTEIIKNYDHFFVVDNPYQTLLESYQLLKIYRYYPESLTNDDRNLIGKLKENIKLAVYDNSMLIKTPSLNDLRDLIDKNFLFEQDISIINRYHLLLIMISINQIYLIKPHLSGDLLHEILVISENYEKLARSKLNKCWIGQLIPHIVAAILLVFERLGASSLNQFKIGDAVLINKVLKYFKHFEFFSDNRIQQIYHNWKMQQIYVIGMLFHRVLSDNNNSHLTFFKNNPVLNWLSQNSMSCKDYEVLIQLQSSLKSHLGNPANPGGLTDLITLDKVITDLVKLEETNNPRTLSRSFR